MGIEQAGARVIDLAAQRNKRQQEKSSAEYGGYLQTLEIAQLEGEANHLLEEFSGQNLSPDYPQKVQLLLVELADRADEPFKQAIRHLGSSIEGEL